MRQITRRQALVAGGSGLIVGPSVAAIFGSGGVTDAMLAAAIENFHELEDRLNAATAAADLASFALKERLAPPGRPIQRYMLQGLDGTWGWIRDNRRKTRLLAVKAQSWPADDPGRKYWDPEEAAFRDWERRQAITVRASNVERLRAKEDDLIQAHCEALFRIVETPACGPGGVLVKLRLADEHEEFTRDAASMDNEYYGPYLVVSAMNDLARMSVNA